MTDQIAVGDGGIEFAQDHVGGNQAVDRDAAQPGPGVADRGGRPRQDSAHVGLVGRIDCDVAAGGQVQVIERGVHVLRQEVAHHGAAHGGHAARAGQVHRGVNFGTVIGLHREIAPHPQMEHLGAPVRWCGLRGCADPGVGAGADAVRGRHITATAKETRIVVSGNPRQLGGLHGGLDREMACGHDRGVDDPGQRFERLFGAQVGRGVIAA